MAAAADDKAAKQFNTYLKTVTSLKDSTYHLWLVQMERAALAAGWHDSIMDVDAAEPANPTHKEAADSRYAYLLVMQTTDGSAVEDILTPCS
jgi:uncharacterized protein HemY